MHQVPANADKMLEETEDMGATNTSGCFNPILCGGVFFMALPFVTAGIIGIITQDSTRLLDIFTATTAAEISIGLPLCALSFFKRSKEDSPDEEAPLLSDQEYSLTEELRETPQPEDRSVHVQQGNTGYKMTMGGR